jgi:hypothetical protein
MSATKDVRKRKERLSVNSFRNELLGPRKTSDSQRSYIHNNMAGGCSGSSPIHRSDVIGVRQRLEAFKPVPNILREIADIAS